MNNKANKINKEMSKILNLLPREASLRISNSGVPHLVIKKNDIIYSACWMGTKKVVRLFYPYGNFSVPQTKIDFTSAEELVFYLGLSTTDGEKSGQEEIEVEAYQKVLESF